MLLPAPVTDDEWNMVATIMRNGSGFATLRESVMLEGATIPLSDLTPEQWIAVVIERVKHLPLFKVYMFGAGVVDQERALRELREHTSVSRVLVEIQQNLIRNLYLRATDEGAQRQRASHL
jgi:hypothetical protein